VAVPAGQFQNATWPYPARPRGHPLPVAALRNYVPGMLRFSWAASSHRGLVRADNEDSGFAGPYLLLVADGVGGAAAGEVASANTK